MIKSRAYKGPLFGLDEAEEAFNASKKAVIDMLDDETKKILDEEFANTDKF